MWIVVRKEVMGRVMVMLLDLMVVAQWVGSEARTPGGSTVGEVVGVWVVVGIWVVVGMWVMG